MTLRFIIDENCGVKLSEALNSEGYDSIPVIRSMAGAPDILVLERAEREERIVITSDKDFGELIYKQGLAHHGVILLRLETDEPAARITVVRRVILRSQGNLKGRFVVATEKKIRIR